MRRTLFLFVCLVSAISSPVYAEEALPESPEIVTEGESPPDVEEVTKGDIANVINPEDAGSENGIVKLVKESDDYVDVYRSGVIVERLALVEDGSCEVAKGQIGKVSFCSNNAKLELEGRPAFTCPDKGSNEYGPCSMPQES